MRTKSPALFNYDGANFCNAKFCSTLYYALRFIFFSYNWKIKAPYLL